MRKTFITIFIISAFVVAKAEIFLPRIFSNNMVLQRQTPVKIWGKADANSVVGIEFAGQKIETKAKKDGSWLLHLKPLKANSTPQLMKIYENGEVSKEINNILVGEVWVAGGQSNMQWTLAQIKVLEDDLARGENPLIRMFTQPNDVVAKTPQYDSPEGSKWELCSSDNFRDFSALSFFFAEELSEKLKIPVAIIQTSLGGARMIPWLAIEDIERTPAFEKELVAFNFITNGDYNYKEALLAWENQRQDFLERKKLAQKDNLEFVETMKKRPANPSSLRSQSTPSYLYNAKIAPIAGFTSRGFLWYQGESDSSDSKNFSAKFDALIRSWRKYWGKNMPFYFVQLPSYGKANESWAETRWQQYLTKQKMRSVEMAVSVDTGEANNIHPADKEIISKRLAKIAQKRIYNNRFMTGEYGPMLKGVSYVENIAKVEFNLFGRKLEQKGDLRGFEILVDEKWILPSTQEVDLQTAKVVLTSPEGTVLEGVRYLWKPWAKPDVCLYSDLGLPAMSFIDEKKNSAIKVPPLKKSQVQPKQNTRLIRLPKPNLSARPTISESDWRDDTKKEAKKDSKNNKKNDIKNDESL